MTRKALQVLVALVYFSGALALESTLTGLVLITVGVVGLWLLSR